MAYTKFRVKKILPVLIFFLWLTQGVAAQVAEFSVGQTITISDKEAADGDVMSFTDKAETLVRSQREYDERMYGVLVADPVAVYETSDDIPVVRSGIFFVNVSDIGGAISEGDYVTSSEIPGKAMKAEGAGGYMLGVALGSFPDQVGTETIEYKDKQYRVGKLKVSVGIGPASPAIIKASGGLFGTLKFLVSNLAYNLKVSRQLDRVMRYVLAVLVALLFLLVAFWFFGRAMIKGVEAMGRNPLAKAQIQTMIAINGVILVVLVAAGVMLSLAVLSL